MACALALGLIPGLRLAGGQGQSELGQILLAALGLIVAPLVGRFRLANGRLVLVQQGIILGFSRRIAEKCAYRGQNGGQGGNARGKPIAAVAGMLYRVIVWAVYVK